MGPIHRRDIKTMNFKEWLFKELELGSMEDLQRVGQMRRAYRLGMNYPPELLSFRSYAEIKKVIDWAAKENVRQSQQISAIQQQLGVKENTDNQAHDRTTEYTPQQRPKFHPVQNVENTVRDTMNTLMWNMQAIEEITVRRLKTAGKTQIFQPNIYNTRESSNDTPNYNNEPTMVQGKILARTPVMQQSFEPNNQLSPEGNKFFPGGFKQLESLIGPINKTARANYLKLETLLQRTQHLAQKVEPVDRQHIMNDEPDYEISPTQKFS
jgi:hypothetical protein